MAREQVQFTQVDVDSLSASQYEAFVAYLTAKAAFRASLQPMAPSGCKIVFTEKYGTVDNPQGATLKVALVRSAPVKAKGKISLSDWIDNRNDAGQSV